MTDGGNDRSAKDDAQLEGVRARAAALMDEGEHSSFAWRYAEFEHKIASWPDAWGKRMLFLICGDTVPLQAEVRIEELGITILPEQREGATVFGPANPITKVFMCFVDVEEKSPAGVQNAVERIELLLGSWAISAWGNSSLRWWSNITHGFNSGALIKFDQIEIENMVNAVSKYPGNVKRKILDALYWIREPGSLIMEQRPDLLPVYVGYWNAFECLVDAFCQLDPPAHSSKAEKRQQLSEYLSALKGEPTLEDIDYCYNNIVDKRQRPKAEHALKVCFGEAATGYIEECFTRDPPQTRLYKIRNQINHGEIGAENIEEMMRISPRLMKLRLMVFGMLGQLVPFRYPKDTVLFN